MKKEILIFLATLVILGGTFTAYLDWLLIQPRPVVAQVKLTTLSPHAQLKSGKR